jgi:hypothetical protein
MGPVATKAMKGYSDEDLREAIDDFKVRIPVLVFTKTIYLLYAFYTNNIQIFIFLPIYRYSDN